MLHGFQIIYFLLLGTYLFVETTNRHQVFYPTHQFFLTNRSLYLIVFKFGDQASVNMVPFLIITYFILVCDMRRR